MRIFFIGIASLGAFSAQAEETATNDPSWIDRRFALECIGTYEGHPLYRGNQYYFSGAAALSFEAAPKEIHELCQFVKPDPIVDSLQIMERET